MKILLLLLAAIIFAGCQHNVESEGVAEVHEFTQNTRVVDVINCKSFDGFGLGEGTVAQGWLDNAINFWQQNSGGI